ncbi:keratin-associated protein 14-like [Meriones unguiculatus]|uniref:keratin-associated protein 14-like n=1 Tax=Meriones unguiculatus TaxID=10047 RepID=UPI000B4FA172|nr:keratin-associated protein 14-like [Meriones unguiculatus]
MSCNSCSGNVSQSFGGQLQYPISSCGSSYPNNVFYSTDLQTPITHQLGCSLQSGCQETCEPIGCQTSYVVSSPYQRPCYRQRIPVSCSPCQSAFSGSLGFGSRGFQSFGCGYPTVGFGSRGGFQSVGCGTRTFSSLNCGSSFYRPTCFSSKSCQSVSYQPTCGTGFF